LTIIRLPGGHFNPTARQHGFLNPRGLHAGDLPNIEVPKTTQLSVEYLVADVTLDPGPRSQRSPRRVAARFS